MVTTETRRFLLLAILGGVSLFVIWFVSRAPVRGPEHELARTGAGGGPAGPVEGGPTAIDPRAGIESAVLTGPGLRQERRALETSGLSGAALAGPSVARLLIVDRSSGTPIAGATVTRTWAEGGWMSKGRLEGGQLVGEWASEVSGEDGSLELQWVNSLQVDARLEVDGFVPCVVGALSASPAVSPGEAADDVHRIELVRAALIVVEPTGFPAGVGGLVMLFEDGDARGRRPNNQTRWNGERTVTFDNVEPGRVSVALAVRGYPMIVKQSIPAAPGEDVHVELAARRGETLRGRVVERTTRQPLAGVRIRARPNLSGVSPNVEGVPFPVVTSGSDGSFAIEGLPIGRVRLQLTSTFAPPVDREVTVIEGESTRVKEVAISGAASLSGRVLLPADSAAGIDRPAGPTLVAVMPLGDVAGLRIEDFVLTQFHSLTRRGAIVEVEGDGFYRFEQVPSGRSLAVVVTSPAGLGFASAGVPLRVGEERRGVDVTVTPSERSSFRVTDADGVPVEAVEVSLRWRLGGRGLRTGLRAMEGPGGLYVVSADARTVFRIHLRAEGFLKFDSDWPVVDGIPERQPVFALTRSATVQVLVRDTDGLSVPRALVVAVPQDVYDAGDDRASRVARRTSRTNGFGRATLTLDRGGLWVVRVRSSGHAPKGVQQLDVATGEHDQRLEFILEPRVAPEPATVVGTLVRKGSGAPLPAIRFDGLQGGSAEIDGARFRIVGLRPGRVKLIAHADGFESVKIPVETLAAGEVRDVGEIWTRGATRVDVNVRDKAGDPVLDARVRLFRLAPNKGGRTGLPKRLDLIRRSSRSGIYGRSAVARVKWRLIVEQKRSKRVSRIVTIKGGRQTIAVVLEGR